MESMSKFASKADFWEAVAKRFGRALVDVMDGMKDHDIAAQTGLGPEDCQRIDTARSDAKRLLEAKPCQLCSGSGQTGPSTRCICTY
ncbi:hypothetical protein [Ottowia sp.]|uniref:hypothetical protein n=1 Tax=Ottowia sp. TaxID=1898956 RepID=UPI0025E52DE8|nr:hypothetical protein [Ottowia sp.]MBK6616337.1 hypothetical protein [Ottowia sp.]